MNKFLVAFLLALLPLHSSAEMGRDGNGGSDIGLELKFFGAKAAAIVASHPRLYPEVAGRDLLAVLDGALVLVSLEPIYVAKGGVVQECTAKNIRSPDTIIVNKRAWDKIRSESVKQALALHEILGLAGIESTGDYRVSNRFLRSLGVDCQSGLCDDRPEAGFGPMRFDAICQGPKRGSCLYPPASSDVGDRYPVMGGGSCVTSDHGFFDPFEGNDQLDDTKFTCDTRGVSQCIQYSLEIELFECNENAKKAGVRPADKELCIRKARETSRRNAPLTGIGTNGRCYIAVP